MTQQLEPLEFLQAVEEFIGREFSYSEALDVFQLMTEGETDVQHVANLLMTREDYRRVYGG